MKNYLFKVKKLTTSIVSITSLVTSFIPQECSAASLPIDQLAEGIVQFSFSRQDILPLAATIGNQPGIDHYLEALTVAIREAKDPLASTNQFFSAFLNATNTSQNSSLEMEDVYRQLRQNAGIVPAEYRDALYTGVYALEENCIPSLDELNTYSETAAAFYWPWQWNWFGLNKQGGQGRANSVFCKVPYGKYIVFALIVASLTYVAAQNPTALPATLDVLKQAALFCGVV